MSTPQEKERKPLPFPIDIIGTGTRIADLSLAHLNRIDEADLIIAGSRLLKALNRKDKESLPIDANLSGILTHIRKVGEKKNIVVLTSGDPFFFGIGSYLTTQLGPEKVRVHPNISTLSAAFARLKTTWANVPAISLHGRNGWDTLFETLLTASKVFVLTDPENNPAAISRWLLAKSFNHFRIHVFEQLGDKEERVSRLDLSAAMNQTFKTPNAVVLEKREENKNSKLYIGMPDDHYVHENGLITKPEIRAITLSKLCLKSDHILWDLGAGSGAVSIESTVLIKTGRIFAVEKSLKRCEQIKANITRFGVLNMSVLQKTLPDGIDDLPAPDRIFIGGGGKGLGSIIEKALNRLKENGRMVINTVLLESLEIARNTLKANGLSVETIQVQVQKSAPMPFGERLVAQNPVWILSCEKK